MTTPTIRWYHPAFLIATWFGSGKVPFAPGTMGSLATFPLFILSAYLLRFASSEDTFINLYLLCVTLLFIVGQWATHVYMKHTGKHDPKEVVIDEVVGQMLVFFAGFTLLSALPASGGFTAFYGTAEAPVAITSFSQVTDIFSTNPAFTIYVIIGTPVYVLCFGLFRLFDIWKPWPIRYCDKNIKGSFGVMFDDLFAAMYAVFVLYGTALGISYLFQ